MTAFEPLSSLKPCNTTSLSYYDLSTRDARYLHFYGTVTSQSDSSSPGCKGRFVRREDLNGLHVSGVTAVPIRWLIDRKGITVTRFPNQLGRLWNLSLGQGLCRKNEGVPVQSVHAQSKGRKTGTTYCNGECGRKTCDVAVLSRLGATVR